VSMTCSMLGKTMCGGGVLFVCKVMCSSYVAGTASNGRVRQRVVLPVERHTLHHKQVSEPAALGIISKCVRAHEVWASFVQGRECGVADEHFSAGRSYT
jgi:hypothetical protein